MNIKVDDPSYHSHAVKEQQCSHSKSLLRLFQIIAIFNHVSAEQVDGYTWKTKCCTISWIIGAPTTLYTLKNACL